MRTSYSQISPDHKKQIEQGKKLQNLAEILANEFSINNIIYYLELLINLLSSVKNKEDEVFQNTQSITQEIKTKISEVYPDLKILNTPQILEKLSIRVIAKHFKKNPEILKLILNDLELKKQQSDPTYIEKDPQKILEKLSKHENSSIEIKECLSECLSKIRDYEALNKQDTSSLTPETRSLLLTLEDTYNNHLTAYNSTSITLSLNITIQALQGCNQYKDSQEIMQQFLTESLRDGEQEAYSKTTQENLEQTIDTPPPPIKANDHQTRVIKPLNQAPDTEDLKLSNNSSFRKKPKDPKKTRLPYDILDSVL